MKELEKREKNMRIEQESDRYQMGRRLFSEPWKKSEAVYLINET